MPPPQCQLLLREGGAGGIGKVMRERMRAWTRVLRLSDREPLGDAREGEEVVRCDLADRAATLALLDGVDAMVHFGGVSVEAAFDPTLQSNIIGCYNVAEGARPHAVTPCVFASS